MGARAIILCFVLASASCAALDPTRVGPRGLPPTVEALSFATVATRQDALMGDLARLAGIPVRAQPGGLPPVPDLPASDPRWFMLYKAGLGMIDGQCDEYLDALFRFNRERIAGQKGLTALTATTATILGATGAGGTSIAVTGAAFGLASALFDAGAQTVLFLIEPSAIRNVVVQAQGAYKAATLPAGPAFASRPDVALGLQGYLSICTPASIEASVNDAAAQRTFDPPKDAQGNIVFSVNPALTPGSRDAAPIAQRPPAPPPPVTAANSPRSLLPSEARLGLTLDNARTIQRALCSAGEPDGDFGPAGSVTRTAIADFQRARSLRETRRIDGVLRDVDANELLAAGPCPSGFGSAFERFYFGDPAGFATTDPGRLANALEAVGSPTTGTLADLRAAMTAANISEADLAAMLDPN